MKEVKELMGLGKEYKIVRAEEKVIVRKLKYDKNKLNRLYNSIKKCNKF